MIPWTIPCTLVGTVPCTPAGTVLYNHHNTNSIVGADIFLYSIVGAVKLPYGKAPHVPLGIDSVVGARIYRMGERGDTPHMPLGIEQYLQVPTSTIPEEDKRNLPHTSDILQ
jgi:hypothetical protein